MVAGLTALLLAVPTGRAGQIGVISGLGSWTNAGSLTYAVNSLAITGTNAYVADYIYVSHPVGTNWSNLGSSFGGTVLCVKTVSGQVYAGGTFQTAKRAACWNGSAWGTLGAGFASGEVDAIAGSDSNTVYAGGSFTGACNRVAMWNGSLWTDIGAALTGTTVNALALDGAGNLYAAGAFGLRSNANGNGIAKWNGANWTNLGSGVNGKVYALAFDGAGNLYAGGSFTQAGGITVNGIAKWDGSAWSGLGSGMSGGSGSSSGVVALAFASDGTLYAGGSFTNAGGVLGTIRIAKWDGFVWSALNTNGMNNTVNALAAADTNGSLYAGGAFTLAGGIAASHIAKWTPGATMSSGVSPSVALAGSSVTISGTGLCNGQINDIASVTLCGVAAAVQSVAGSTQIVVTAGAGGAGVGDVVVSSASSGLSIKTNGFRYMLPPTIVNDSASSITTSGATLNATLVSTGSSPTTVRFYWGTSDGSTNLGSWFNMVNLGVHTAGPVSVSLATNLLTAQTRYCYRALASNGDGTSWAPATTNFTTQAPVLWTLTVASPYGTPVPVSGTNYSDGAVIAAYVNGSPASGGAGTQYVCTGWTLSGNAPVIGTATNFSLTLTNNATLTWTWATQVTFAVAAGPHGSVSGNGGWYALGGSVTVTGVPAFGYHFACWTGDVPAAQTNQNPLLLTLDQARAVTANFAINHYTLTADAGAHGQVSPSVADVAHGGQAAFQVTADPNYRIADVLTNGASAGLPWRNTDVATNFVWTNVQGDGALSVLFTPQIWTITATAGAHGAITPAATNVAGGGSAAFAIAADLLWHIQDVTVDGADAGVTNAVSFANVTGNHALTAAFAPDAAAGHQSDGYHAPGTNTVSCVFSNNSGRPLLSLLCRPALPAGWTLQSASGDGAPEVMNGEIVFLGSLGIQPLSFQYTVAVPPSTVGVQMLADTLEYQTSGMGAAADLPAAPDPLVLTGRQTFVVASARAGAWPAVGSHLVAQGSMLACAVTNSPVPGDTPATQYVCTGWTGTGSVTPASGAGTNIPAFAVTNDSTLTWLWSTQCWLSVSAGPGGAVTAPSGWYDWGGALEITATPRFGFVFSNWTGDVADDLRASNPLTLPVDQTRSIAASFAVRLQTAVASQSCDGYRSPGTNNTVICAFEYPADQTLTALVWRPILPAGGALATAFGDGNPAVLGGNLVFSGGLTSNPVSFGFTFAVASGASATGTLSAEAQYLYGGTPPTDPLSVAPDDLAVSRLHSADYRTNFWVIDNSEVNRVLAYWRAGGYAVSPDTPDGFAPASSPAPLDAGIHSADFQAPYGVIDAQEMNRVLVYWRAGGYHVSSGTCDGYAPGLPDPPQSAQPQTLRMLGLSDPAVAQSGPAVYDPGQVLTVTNTLTVGGSLWGLYWRPQLPPGWTILSVTNLNAGDPLPELVNCEILWTSATLNSPVGMQYRVRVPPNEVRARSLRAQVGYWIAGQPAEALAAPAALVSAARDTDGDGLPDAYELRYTGSTTNMSPTDDLDGDGMNNLAECLAGTDATNAQSVLKVTAFLPWTNGTLLIRWQSATNQIYDIQRATNLCLGFVSIVTNIPATPPENAYPLAPAAGGAGFLRILVE